MFIRKLLLLLMVIGSSLACVSLSGCDGEKTGEVVNKTVNDFQNGLETDNRAAIQKVGKTISGALDT